MSQIVAENNKCESGLVVVKKVNHRFKELKKKDKLSKKGEQYSGRNNMEISGIQIIFLMMI